MAAPHRYQLSTTADLSFEPDDGLRRELHDGVMHVVPPAGREHNRAVLAVYRRLFSTAPPSVEIHTEVGVHTGLRRYYVPDLLVVDAAAAFHDNGFDPGGVLLVVEAVSPGSVTMDRVTKPAIYAEQGIPFFWRIEGVDGASDFGPRLQAFRLDPSTGGYRLVSELGAGESGEVLGPWTVSVDMSELAPPSG
ncbi:MAG: Uma2 family endonuclease [Pseudonocardia sp.]|nr:Uma2 family endonuclease [Pseudonocardia sp.]